MVTPRKTEQIRQASYPARELRAHRRPIGTTTAGRSGCADEKCAPDLYSCRLSFRSSDRRVPMSEVRQILVTSALPYANGSIHLGHMLEYIQTDMWVRFQKLRGNQCIYVCADDAHGAAIMLRAEKAGITPEQLIANVQAEHGSDFADFLVDFDNFHSTHSEENREFAELIYTRLRDAGHIATRSVTQYFDPEKGMFLADRFIKGTCPKCG